MTTIDTIIPTMAKSGWIQIRVTEELKASIDQAAKRDGRTVSNWLIWLAAHHDANIRRAAGMPASLSDMVKEMTKDN
jgi:uncharacterized protein (DUF1778 family)